MEGFISEVINDLNGLKQYVLTSDKDSDEVIVFSIDVKANIKDDIINWRVDDGIKQRYDFYKSQMFMLKVGFKNEIQHVLDKSKTTFLTRVNGSVISTRNF